VPTLHQVLLILGIDLLTAIVFDFRFTVVADVRQVGSHPSDRPAAGSSRSASEVMLPSRASSATAGNDALF
jgi:hypothetical protein